ncbi:hypothetical protein [Marinobacter zhanjiangensis]|uniref:Phospholipase_D-nuclease N-terminal n=1 Tax=Marinobacter zhanjiangensis TaxID=578215 RepID=A0ABQ3AQ94_9GAMM|nr:hypothetical protein [Marinobacter zhanjiangensis]GGY61335.1 hypothetical protein GCM10007071_05190 [Marinobacter zhanjiangensis]
MAILRTLLVIQLLACLSLYSARTFDWRLIDGSPALDWVFMFAYPMAYAVFVPALILLVTDIIRFKRRTPIVAIGWISFDVLFPILSYVIFELYYNQIGQM